MPWCRRPTRKGGAADRAVSAAAARMLTVRYGLFGASYRVGRQ